MTVTGLWMMTSPTEQGYLAVMLRGRDDGGAVCHFEDVPAADRIALDGSLSTGGELAIRGRYDGTANGFVILRRCRLLD